MLQLRGWLKTLTALLLAAIFAVVVAALWPVSVASSLRAQLRELEEGPFPKQRLDKWATDYGGTVDCASGVCWAAVRVKNHAMWFLGLVPASEFDAEIRIKDGELVQKSFRLVSKPNGSDAAVITECIVNFEKLGANAAYHGAHLAEEPVGKPPGVVYSVYLGSTAADTGLAYDINLWCLARIGGCSGAEQAPRLWALRRW